MKKFKLNKLINTTSRKVLTDASLLITEACVQSGADAFIGYPITPSNKFYAYGSKRFPLFLAGPDEITVLQWMSGMAASGKFPVTATAFPGLALMIESINMAYMMELPMLIILTQRLGPSTGSATTSAQGDLSLLNGMISGGYPIPVFCPSNFEDCWEMTAQSIKTAVKFRTPVILLTSKEMVMTQRSFDLTTLNKITPFDKEEIKINGSYLSYQADENLIPPFLPVGNQQHQVRINSSTHDNEGLIRKGNPESLANTRRLKAKFEKQIEAITFYELDELPESNELIVSYGISSDACKDAITMLRANGKNVSHLIVKTMLPIPEEIISIMNRFEKITVVEENISGQYKNLVFGAAAGKNIQSVNKIGDLIYPSEIIKELV